jgi:hypothetical protein
MSLKTAQFSPILGRYRLRSLSAGLLVATLFGCGGQDKRSGVNGDNSGASPSVSGSGNATGGSGSGAGSASGSNTGGTSSGGGIDLGPVTDDDDDDDDIVDPGEACAKGTASATLSSVNMFVMFDRSSSMTMPANQNGTRWELTSTALNAFFASPEAAGLRLALRFFPHDLPAAGCNQTGCDVTACATQLVDLAELTTATGAGDAQEAALINATTASVPGMAGQGTPIYAALGGALQRASTQRMLAPNENSVVVLVTDGEPNGCDTDIDHIAALSAAAYSAEGIRTYAIGLTGSREADMDQIAVAGGTTKGIFISDGANTKQELLDALSSIRGQVLDCDFAMPIPTAGVEVDKALINVTYTPTGGMPTTLKQVASEASCIDDGWYYDDPVTPTRIVLCSTTCANATVDATASLDILLGCATTVDIPR